MEAGSHHRQRSTLPLGDGEQSLDDTMPPTFGHDRTLAIEATWR